MAGEIDRAQRGIQSIEVGGQVLLALVHHGRPMALKDLARAAGMAPAKAHPYLVSYARLGLIEQGDDGLYFLGPLALQLGLISLQQADPVQLATPVIESIARSTGQTAAIAVWGTCGATIVRLAESPAVVRVNMRHGTVFSLASTASGRLFAAYQAPAEARAHLEAERVRQREEAADRIPGMPAAPALPGWKAFQAQLAEVRARGLSRSVGEVVPGIDAMAAPVFDHTGALVLALIAIGPAAVFDSAWDGPLARALRAGAAELCARLGAPPRA